MQFIEKLSLILQFCDITMCDMSMLRYIGEKNWEIHHFWVFGHFYPFICNVWYFRCHFLVFHPRKPLFWCIICQCWEIKKISFFSNFSNIFTIFSKPSWWTLVNFDSWCNVQNHLMMFFTKFQLVSSYFRIRSKFHWTE